jgi:MFS family permease
MGAGLPLLTEFRALDPRIWILTAARVVVTFGFSMVMPFLAFHLSQKRAVAAVAVGLIWTASSATGAAAQWAAGAIADRWGRRPVILTAMVLRAANLALLGAAIARTASIPVIGLLCVANAVLRAFFDPVASAMIADISTGEQRVAAFSLQRIGVNIGWAAGPAVAAIALEAGASYAGLFYVSAPVTLVATFAIARIRETRAPSVGGSPSGRTRFLDLFHVPADPPFRRFLAATFAFFLLQVQLYQTLSIFAARALRLSQAEVGRIYFENGLIVVALQVPAFYYIRRIGTRGALIVGSLAYAAAYASCGLARGYPSLLLCVAGVTLAEMVSAPAQQTTATSMAPPGRVGAYAGLFGLAQAAGQALGPLAGGFLFDRFGDRRIWAFLPVFGIVAAWGYSRVSPPQSRNQRGQGGTQRRPTDPLQETQRPRRRAVPPT